MVLVKILGAIDLAAALAFLMFIFGLSVPTVYVLFCAFLLLPKGLFVIKGDVLSFVDIFSSIILILSLVFPLPPIFLWMPAFLLIAKGVISFV